MFVFTDKNFEEKVLSSDSGVVMVDFYASWCGPCIALSPAIEELASDYDGKVLVGKYSTEDDQEYASQLNIMSIPCVKFWKNGEYVGEIIGLKGKEDYQDKLDELLA